MPQPWNGCFGSQPVVQEETGDQEFQFLGADPTELVRNIAGPRKQFFEDFASPVKAVRVGFGPRFLVDQAVGGKSGPFAVPRILVGLELRPEERNAVPIGSGLAIPREAISVRMLGGGVVEDDYIAPGRIEKTVVEQGEQKQPAGPSARKLDDMGKIPMALRPIAKDMPLPASLDAPGSGSAPPSFGDAKSRNPGDRRQAAVLLSRPPSGQRRARSPLRGACAGTPTAPSGVYSTYGAGVEVNRRRASRPARRRRSRNRRPAPSA